jgi:hypothetical protein
MHIAWKILRLFGLLILLFLGLGAILAAHIGYIATKVPVSILGDGSVNLYGWDQGFVSARGTWAMEGHDHALPLNMSDIRCVRAEEVCYVAEAHLDDGYLNAQLEIYHVEKWDSSTLEFGTDAACVTYAYVVSRSTEKLTGRRLKKATTDPICKSIVIEPDVKLAFVNGLSVVRSLQDQHAPTFFSIAAATLWGLVILAWMVRVARR